MMFDKFEARCQLVGSKVAYAQLNWKWLHHYRRYIRHVKSAPDSLPCQECHGRGGEISPVIDDGQGPWESCGFCEGTGLVTPWMRGLWLRYRRDEKRDGKSR